MIDRGRVLEQQWAERYVAGQLTPEEVREFEETMLEHPEVLELVEHARTVKLGLKTLRERGELESLVGARPRTRQWWLAAAAAVMVGAVGLLWLKGSEAPTILAASLDQLTTRGQQPSAGHDFLIARTRGSETIAIEASAADPVIVLRVLIPASRAGMVHRVELFHGNERIAKLEAAPVGDYLPLYLDTTKLESGEYALRLATPAEQVPEITYPLHLKRR